MRHLRHNLSGFQCLDILALPPSFAAPQWAGYLALANQQSENDNSDTLGFINPALYSIGLSPSYDTNFHDIIRGSNSTRSAKKGYDLVTGWGSPNQSGLIDSLVP